MEKSSLDKTTSGMAKSREYIDSRSPMFVFTFTDAGEGRPIVLLTWMWPLSDEMYEYQYNDLLN